MENDTESKTEVAELYQRFADLFASDHLSKDEKQSLSNEILKAVYQDSKEVI